MKSWVRDVRALTASMVELRGERAELMSRCCELRGDLPSGSAQFLLHLGLSRGELMAMPIEGTGERDDRRLLDVAAQVRQIDGQIEVLERRVRAIAAAAAADIETEAVETASSPPPSSTNVLPFRQRPQARAPLASGLVEVA